MANDQTQNLALAHAVLMSPDLVPFLVAQADFPTLLVMQATCSLWRQAALPAHKQHMFDVLGQYFADPSAFADRLVQLNGAVSGSSILRFLFPTDPVGVRALTDLDVCVPQHRLQPIHDFLHASGYVLLPEAGGNGEEEDGKMLPGLHATTHYDLIEQRHRYHRNGRIIDLLGCHDSETSDECERRAKGLTKSRPQVAEVVEHFYCTLLMSMWTGEKLICLAPHLTFAKQMMIGKTDYGQEFMRAKWEPCGFQVVEGPYYPDMPGFSMDLDIRGAVGTEGQLS